MDSNLHDAPGYPCIIDVRAFAKEARARSEGPVRGDVFGARRYVELPIGPTALGLIELDASAGRVEAMPRDEFILAMEGRLRIKGAAEFVLRAGESAVLPKNAEFSWEAEEPTLLAFICQESQASDGRVPVKIDPTRPRVAAPPLRDGLVIGDMPKAFRHTDFESEDGLFVAGSWHANGYARRPIKLEYFELMHLLEGSVALTDEAGVEHIFRKDDIIVARKGGAVNWVSTEKVSKVAAICRA